MLKQGATLDTCPNCGRTTPVYHKVRGYAGATICQYCRAEIFWVEGRLTTKHLCVYCWQPIQGTPYAGIAGGPNGTYSTGLLWCGPEHHDAWVKEANKSRTVPFPTIGSGP